MKQQLLLLNDVDGLGKKGEVVIAKAGYVRNFLLPKKLAVVASANTLRKQVRLREERAKQATVDRKDSEELSRQIESITLETHVKVDPEGHMYGSVSASDVALLLQEQGLPVERKYLQLPRPIKVTGKHRILMKLKEGVVATCTLNIVPQGVTPVSGEEMGAPVSGKEAEAASQSPSVISMEKSLKDEV
jgi:large subunit ribosomal protein L9